MKVEKILFIHDYLVEYFSDKDDPVSPPGVKNRDLLDSAAARPYMSVGSKDAYEGVFNKAAALFHSIVNNHCFHNGNKRAALLSTIVFLSEKGYWLTIPTDEEMLKFTKQAASHSLGCSRDGELAVIALWLKKNSRRRGNREQPLKLQQLKDILSGFGFVVGDPDGSTIPVFKDGVRKTKIRVKGTQGKEDYDKQYVSKLRKKLKLTQEYGVDSLDFYGASGFKNELYKFMSLRANVMRELART